MTRREFLEYCAENAERVLRGELNAEKRSEWERRTTWIAAQLVAEPALPRKFAHYQGQFAGVFDRLTQNFAIMEITRDGRSLRKYRCEIEACGRRFRYILREATAELGDETAQLAMKTALDNGWAIGLISDARLSKIEALREEWEMQA